MNSVFIKPKINSNVSFIKTRNARYIQTKKEIIYVSQVSYDVLSLCNGSHSVCDISYQLTCDYKANVTLQQINEVLMLYEYLF
jgi:hypothetical protein